MIDDILNLEATEEAVKRISKFLNKTDINDENHALVVSHLLSLYEKTNQMADIIKIVDTYTTRYENHNSIIILDKLIEISLNNKDKETCLKTINQKKELLESYDLNYYYEDMINYNNDNLLERIRYINLFLQNDPSKTSRLKGMYLLAKAYIDNNQFEKFFTNLDNTKELALELGNMEIFESLVYFEASYLYEKKEYDNALDKLNENNVRSEHFGNLINLLILKIYFQQGKYRKCIILEAQCEEGMRKAPKKVKGEFYSICIELYELTNNKTSLDFYKSKLKENNYTKDYSNLDSFIEDNIKSIKINKEKKNEVKVEKPVFKTIKKVKPSLNEMSDFYQESTVIFQQFYLNKDYREQVRLSLLKLNEQVNFNDCYIVLNQESFHYKKERLYNKKDVNFSIIDLFHDVNTEIISFNTQKDNIKNPFSNDDLEYNTAVIFPLFDEKCIGAIYFTSEEDSLITGKLNYEKLHCYAKFYNSICLLNYEKEQVVNENKSKLEILNSKMFYYAYIEDDYFYCGLETQKLLGCRNKIIFNSFLSHIHTDDYLEFSKNFHNLQLEEYFQQILKLSNNKKVLIKVTKTSEYKYLLIIEDYTEIEAKKDSLIVSAYHNPITNLRNNQALNIEIDRYFEMKKFSAILVNFKDLKKYTYLYQEKFSLDILQYLGKVLPEFNKDYDYYHLNFDKLIILVKDVNDKRVLKQIINKLDSYLIEKLSNINTRLIPKFTYGTYRSFVDTKEKGVNKMLEILSDSILNVDDNYDDNIGFYDIELYKKRFLKEQLVTYISESIDNKKINVLFSQCVNIKENLIEYYEAKLNLSNYKVDNELINEVIKRRSLSTTLEQYLINRTFHEMNLIFEKTKFSINVVINIDEYSFVNNSFLNYLNEKTLQHKINKKRVIFKINKVYSGAVDNIIKLLESGYQIALGNVDDLSLIKPNYFIFNNFEKSNIFNDEYIKTLCDLLEKFEVKFVLGNTSKNEFVEHYKDTITYFYGSIYSQQLTYLDICNMFDTNKGI